MNRTLDNHIEWDARLHCYQITHNGQRTSLYGMGAEQAQERLSAFLGSIDSFHFCSRDGYVAVVSKIHVQRGGDYWRAAKRIDGKVRQRHVGKTANVTFKTLENVIQRIAQGSPKEQARATERRQEQRMRGYKKRFNVDDEQPQAEQPQPEQPRKRRFERREQAAQAEAASQTERPRKRTREEALREAREKKAREQEAQEAAERERAAQAERERQERERAAQAERARQAEQEQAERKHPTYRLLWIQSERAYRYIDDDTLLSDGYPFVSPAPEEWLHTVTIGFHDGEPFLFGSKQGYECAIYLGPKENDQRSCYAMLRVGKQVRRFDLGSTNDLTFRMLEQAAIALGKGVDGEAVRASRLKAWDAEYTRYEHAHDRDRRRQQERARQRHTYGFTDFGAFSAQHDALRTMGFDAMPGAADLKRRYRDLAMKHHPDRGGDTAMMAKINAANDLLKKFVAA